MRTDEDPTTIDARAPRPIGRWRCVGRFIVALGAVVVLAATSCIHVPVPLSYQLSSAMERDGVLPEGVVCRESGSTQYVCIFGATDPATQDLVVEGARESLRRMGRTRYGVVIVQFWSGDPPPPGVDITIKEQATRIGEPPSTKAAERNARYGISLVRAVKIEAPLSETTP
jgi:hypothetical protein